MKKRSSLAIFFWMILLSLALMSVTASSTIQTNVLSTRVNLAPSKPTVDIVYPRQGDILEFGTHPIDVSASDLTGIDKVKLKIDGPESTNGWVDITANEIDGLYHYDWTVDTEGDYSITARATNGVGRQAADTVGVTVVAAPPERVHDVAVTRVSALPTSVEIGENVIVTVDVENQGDFTETFEVTSYYDSVPIETQTITELAAGASDMLTFTWDTTDVAEGEYTIKAEAILADDENLPNNTFIDGTVTVSAPGEQPTLTHELFIEIDYMPGHKPTLSVLDYIHGYYSDHGIGVTFFVDDQVPSDRSVSDADFWAIEATYNDLGDDKYTGESANFVSKWKWVLFGTRVSGAPSVVGYTYVIVQGGDLLAGNYIFIADTTADRWASQNGLEAYGAEAVVLMHEMGHSIGIAKLDPNGREIYDPDPYSVMSYLSTANAGLYWTWYYSDDYWATRNMEYYTT